MRADASKSLGRRRFLQGVGGLAVAGAASGALDLSLAPAASAATGSKYYYQAAKPTRPRLPGPVRVLMAGDSITGEYAVDGGAQNTLLAQGYDAQTLTNAGYGLLDAPCGAIAKALKRKVKDYDPDVVVLEWRGNYQNFGNLGCNPTVVGDTPAFYYNWQAAVNLVTTSALALGAQVHWIVGPAMATWKSDGTYAADNVNDRVTRTIANNLRGQMLSSFPMVGIIDAYELFPDPWAVYDDGVAVRTVDGLHLTPAGTRILARAVLERIVPHLG